jgi:eukaryotic-like serine/threonine-protein kinase
MATDVPDPAEASRRPGAGGAGEGQSAAGGSGAADNWLAELLNNRAAKQPVEPSAVPTEAAAPASVEASAGKSAGVTDGDPAYIGRYQVIRRLGQGAFGRVFLARDAELQRQVAIKVPITREPGAVVDLELYLNEARVLARLSHPNIVPVHDVGHTADGRGYVVSMFVSGGDLAARLKLGRPAFVESARLIAAICEAMHYAHTRDLFHRDIKPANILIDDFGVPYLADFGLAMKDEDYGRGPRFAGTVAYTSPEQARGEGHLVDGRSDIFSIGVVFYEMLTGRRPFRGDSPQHVLRQIVSTEPRPPRQIDDTIPRELERICLKAIAKRASERYSTSRDMAEDLRHYLSTLSGDRAAEPPFAPLPLLATAPAAEPAPSSAPASAQSDLAQRPIKVVPRGLGSFDEHDADFFLELLPGPRDRDGLPDGLRFWKTRIEATEAEKTFRIGLIYGPSGCGKSSLLKAGLLPLLSPRVKALYVESTAAETEASLLRSLRKAFPELLAEPGLVEAMAFLRRNHSLLENHKVLLVLDQFEQWLFARGRESGSAELIAALRQCDGEHLQALCLVRDDFWMAATRFMRDLEIDLVPHRNVAAVDLFDIKHARRVLAAFGRAYGSLPAEPASASREQSAFLDQATAGLVQDGWIVPVRLALLAEMVKGKPWTPATLRAVGGMDGVGVRFLEETFGSARSNPEHRYHAQAAQAVLKSLLPESNSDIKGRMRSSHELRLACGYKDRPDDFDHLIRILDGDLRLITPVDPVEAVESSSPPATNQPAPATRSYQLTHDYLVHSLRDWLTRKQKSTRRGRAELLLADRAALWSSRPESRHLPLAREWAAIRLLSKPAAWSEPERRMMKQSDQKVAIRGVAAAAVLGTFLAVGLLVRRSYIEAYDSNHARDLVLRLQSAEIGQVPESIAAMSGYRKWTDPALEDLLKRSANDPDRKLRASLALLSEDPGQADYLSSRLIDANPEELAVICDFLRGHAASLRPRLWEILEALGPDNTRVLGCSGALARFDHESPRWKGVAGKVARAMVSVNPIHVSQWLEIFRPVKEPLRDALLETLRSKGRDETDRMHAMNYLVDYSSESPRELVDLIQEAGPKEFALVFPEIEQRRDEALPLLERAIRDDVEPPPRGEAEKDRRAERAAKAAVALFRLEEVERVWPLLAHQSDPRLRSFLIHWLARLGDDLRTVEPCLAYIESAAHPQQDAPAAKPQQPSIDPNRKALFDTETSIRRALFLIVGQFDQAHLAAADRERAIKVLLESYSSDPDPGIHGAARYTLTRWQLAEELRRIDSALAKSNEVGQRRWSVNSAGQTMVHFDGPLEFRMGVPGNDPDYQNEIEHQRRIPRRFAIGATEVSISQFDEFWKKYAASFDKPQFGPGSGKDLPRAGVTWYMAVAYCNWLSEKEGKQPVYARNDDGKFAAGLRCDAQAFDKGGYRLPTEAEWEYACRAGTETGRYYGHSLALLRQYARLTDWDKVSLLPAGSLLPNDFGLFDMFGNVMEWCHDADYDYKALANQPSSDYVFHPVINSRYCVMRGGSYRSRPPDAQSGVRAKYEPGVSEFTIGFRVARSLP